MGGLKIEGPRYMYYGAIFQNHKTTHEIILHLLVLIMRWSYFWDY